MAPSDQSGVQEPGRYDRCPGCEEEVDRSNQGLVHLHHLHVLHPHLFRHEVGSGQRDNGR